MKKLFFLLISSCLFSIISQAQLYFNKDDSTFTSKTEVVAHYDRLTNTFIVDNIHRTEKIIQNIDTTNTESLVIVHSGNSKRFDMAWLTYDIAHLKEGIKDTVSVKDLDEKQTGFIKSWTKSYLCATKEGNTIFLSTNDKSLTAPIKGIWITLIILALVLYLNIRYFLKNYGAAYKEGKVNLEGIDFIVFIAYFLLFILIGGMGLLANSFVVYPCIFILSVGFILRMGLFFPKRIHKLNKKGTIAKTIN